MKSIIVIVIVNAIVKFQNELSKLYVTNCLYPSSKI